MEIDSPPAAGSSTFRPTPALGVTYLLDTEEEDVKIIIPPVPRLPPVDDAHDEDYDPREDQDIDEDDDPEEGPPYPTPSSIVHGKRKATEIYDIDDEEEPRQSDRLRRKKTRSGSNRKEPEYICISSDDDDDVIHIPKPESAKTKERQNSPPKPPVAVSKRESDQDAGPLDDSSASPEPEAAMGSVERLRPDTPNWLDVQLAKIRKRYPSAKLELCYHYSIDGDVWRVKCKACRKTCCTGPGQHLVYLNKHLSGASHQAAIGNIPSAGSSNNARKAAPRREPSPQPAPDRDRVPAAGPAPYSGDGRENAAAWQDGGEGDDVERFLDQLGLPADLAPKLRSFGFADDKRMSHMGRLSDESLGLLLEHLTKEGVDIVPAIMVREGLKRRAGTL